MTSQGAAGCCRTSSWPSDRLESGELDRIIAALSAHARRQWVEVDELAAEQAPAIGTIATVKAWWDKLDLDGLFDQIGDEQELRFRLADAVLQRWRRRHTSSQALALRSRIVLACAERLSNREVAARMGVHEATVGNTLDGDATRVDRRRCC